MAGREPGKPAPATRDDHPGPRRKGRAGLVIVLILLVMVVFIFVARNFEHAEELEENPSPPLPTAGTNG